MKRALVVILLAGSAALSAWAQAPQKEPKVVGKLVNVEGIVMVSSGQSLANAVNGTNLIVGNRIATTSSGAVTLNFDNGCDIKLKANESITVVSSDNCAALLAAVRPVPGAGVPVAAAGSVSLVPVVLFAGGAAAVIATQRSQNRTSGS